MFSSLFGSRSSGPRLGVVTAKEAHEKLAGETTPFLLDVREPSEYREARIAGANLIPLNQIQNRVKEIPADREVIVVCRSGSRSSMATGFLRQSGFNALNLDGGMIAWARAGLPVERG